jgi:hypothetical protein
MDLIYLSEAHRKMLLEESGIDQEVVEARGYRTVETQADLKRLGFSDAQRNVPGLLIPVYSPAGEIATYQYRPDLPRVGRDRRTIKYETPLGTRMMIDFHPSMRGNLDDPAVPLWLSEGIKKTDSLTSRGLCAAALLGVWNWRGTNGRGGKVVLPDWELIALNGKQVYVVFDSDVALKPQVHAALARLKPFLESRGAEVAVIYLPSGKGSIKQGVDDYLVAGNSVDDLLGLATTTLRKPPEDAENGEEPDTQAAELVRYADDAYLFHTPDGESYVTFPLEER